MSQTNSFNNDYAIVLDKIEKKFPKANLTALSKLTTKIKRGAITGLMGPDGAGKTTLLRIIAGLLSVTSGSISVEGLNPIQDLKSLHNIIGYMPQRFGLYEDLTVIENLNLYADLRGIYNEERLERFKQLLYFTNLENFLTRPAGKLSGGMKQKLGLACALLGYPRVLLLDEPSVGVDPISRHELWKMVKDLVLKGITVIWSTSYLDEAEKCHEILLLNEGKLIYSGKPQKIESPLSNLIKPIKESSEVVIEAISLTKKFGNFIATDNINFSVKRGEIFGLLGPNGAGKSTTFKMMCGLLIPTSGAAFVMGIDLHKSASEARQKIGYMAQKFSLYNNLSVYQNLEFFSGIYGLKGKKQRKKISEMVDAFDLRQFLQITTLELPPGFKQRLALACAIMHDPSILFLDEPTSGVDPYTRREFWTHINGLVQKGVTVMVTTHYMDETEYCDRIGLIYRGQLIEVGTPEELKQSAASIKNPKPSMDEAFINIIKKHDINNINKAEKNIDNLENFIKKNKYVGGMGRFLSLCKKEIYQIFRDPSSMLIAFFLPILMLFIYGFGINLDIYHLPIGLVLNDTNKDARLFASSFKYTPYINSEIFPNSFAAGKAVTEGKIRGFVVIQSDFSAKIKRQNGVAPIQIITDGSEPNTANFVTAYAEGAWQSWLLTQSVENGEPISNLIMFEPRYWFNPAAISRDYLIPGSIVIIMTVIGAMLTSMVVAREWERGTMEGLLATPITRFEFLFSKLIPYYFLGIFSMLFCVLVAHTILAVPFRGSLIILFIISSFFLGCVLGIGLLVSTATRNQFDAAQAALNIAFLPAIMFSGFVYEIKSMPIFIQGLTYLFPPRYFVSSLQTLFLAGNIPTLLFKNAICLCTIAIILISWTYKLTRNTLD